MKDFIKKHKIILIIILVVMILAFGGAIAFITLSKKPIVITSNHEKTKEETKEEIKSELDMTVEEQYDSDIIYALSHYSLMFISDYNMLVGYPNAYKDSMICFYAEVVKVIEEGDDKYKIEVAYNNEGDNLLYMVIEGKYSNGVRYLEGELYLFIGVFNGMKTYEIDGTKNILPSITVKKTGSILKESEASINLFTESELKEYYSSFFNNYPMTFSKPSYSLYDTAMNGTYLSQLPFHYLLKLENTGNYKFDEFRIYTIDGDIEVVTDKENSEIYRSISKAKDGTSYLLLTDQEASKHYELQLYDKDFKQLWSRDFENGENLRWMPVNGRIVVYCNNTLYYIDEKTGKDIVTPFTVANVIKLRPLSNGDVIIFTTDKSKFIQYLDSKGKVKWTSSTEYNPTSINILEIGNGKIFVDYKTELSEEDNYVTVYSKDGERVATTVPQN